MSYFAETMAEIEAGALDVGELLRLRSAVNAKLTEHHRTMKRWADVLIGDTLPLGHDVEHPCIVRRVADFDDEHLEITMDCGAGEHQMVVRRQDAVA